MQKYGVKFQQDDARFAVLRFMEPFQSTAKYADNNMTQVYFVFEGEVNELSFAEVVPLEKLVGFNKISGQSIVELDVADIVTIYNSSEVTNEAKLRIAYTNVKEACEGAYSAGALQNFPEHLRDFSRYKESLNGNTQNVIDEQPEIPEGFIVGELNETDSSSTLDKKDMGNNVSKLNRERGKPLEFSELVNALPEFVKLNKMVLDPYTQQSNEKIVAVILELFQFILSGKNASSRQLAERVSEGLGVEVNYKYVLRLIEKLIAEKWIVIKTTHEFHGKDSAKTKATRYKYTKKFTRAIRDCLV